MTDFLEKALKRFPEFMTTQDLIDVGIYNSKDSAYLARKGSCPPPYIKLKHVFLYPKLALIEWLASRAGKVDERSRVWNNE